MYEQRTSEQLKEMQSWPWERKVLVAQTRIAEYYQKMDGKVYVAFSGGKDSTVLLDIVRRMYPEVPAAFNDTGLEFPEIRNFALSFDNCKKLKPEMNFRKVIETYGYPVISKEVSQKIYEARRNPNCKVAQRFDPNSEYNQNPNNKRYSMVKWQWLRDTDIPISHKCCDIMKKKPSKLFEKESGLHPIVGTMASESALRHNQWIRHGCNSFDSGRPMSKPLSIFTDQDILMYIKDQNLKYCSIYGDIVYENGIYRTTKRQRTGCAFCMFGCHLEKCPNRFQLMKESHPILYEYCMRDWDKNGLGLKKVLETINTDYV